MTTPPIEIAFSPCPNDTFIFYGWVHQKSDEELCCNPHYFDIQTLNQSIGQYPLTKASVVSALNHGNDYGILPVGAALGFGCGPLVVGKHPLKKVAIPGKGTVAHLLFDILVEEKVEKVFTTYDQILPMIERGEVDGGLIIHESRFIYQSRGHELLYDLGGLWEHETKLPLPLGVLILHKSEWGRLKEIVDALRNSINYSSAHFSEAFSYIQHLSQEKDRSVIEQHIQLYVNEESYELSELGRQAISHLYQLAKQKGLLDEQATLCFCNPS